MKVFVDWARKKPHTYVLENSENVKSTKSLSQFKGYEIYMEEGCPSGALKPLYGDNTVFLCKGYRVKEIRGDREKSDDNDPLYIRELFQDYTGEFNEVTPKRKIELEYVFAIKMYARYTKDLAAYINKQKSFKAEFGVESKLYPKIMKFLKENKKVLLDSVEGYLIHYLRRIKNLKEIKGIGNSTVAQLLCYANPAKFPTKTAYLVYCGYNQSSWGKGIKYEDRKKSGASFRYSRDVKRVMYTAVDGLILKTKGTPRYRKFYEKCRSDYIEAGFVSKNDDGTTKMENGKIVAGPAHGMAKNRVATRFLGDFWEMFKDYDMFETTLESWIDF